MPHISSFEDSPLVSVRDLTFEYRLPFVRASSLRDQFVSLTFARKMIRHRVLTDINFEIRHGERIALMGVNGAGKSTLCRLLVGFLNPNGGAIIRNGKIRGIFDTSAGFFPELTGRENAKLLLNLLYPENWRDHDRLLEEALAFSELGSFLDAPYRTYSNGMQARLSLSVVSCIPSDILVLDEVFEGADTFFQKKISERIMSLMAASGAVVFVSHSVEQIARVCNRAIILDREKICFDGDVFDAISYYLERDERGRIRSDLSPHDPIDHREPRA